LISFADTSLAFISNPYHNDTIECLVDLDCEGIIDLNIPPIYNGKIPANAIVDMLLGDIFVHHNIANMVIHTDLNCLSVNQYTIEVLKVIYISVFGHSACEGIKAAMDNSENGLIDNWFRNIKDIYRYPQVKIDALQNKKEKINLFCEFNFVKQAVHICQTIIVQSAWKSGKELALHSWIYSIEDFIFKDLNVYIINLEEISQTSRVKLYVNN